MGDPEKHKLIGGELCLEFLNTKNGHRCSQFNEYLETYQDILLWSRHTGILSKKGVHMLQESSIRHPESADRIHQKTVLLRYDLFDIFSAVILKKTPPENALDNLTTHHIEGVMDSKLVASTDRCRWTLKSDDAMDRMLRPIVLSAVRLLTDKKLKLVKQCSGTDCDWFFLDTSRNYKRRWCSMEDCGNRFKMKQRYLRKKNAG